MAISDKVKNIIQTASSSIAALKWKLEGEGVREELREGWRTWLLKEIGLNSL